MRALVDLIERALPLVDEAVGNAGDRVEPELLDLQHRMAAAVHGPCERRGQGCQWESEDKGFFVPCYMDVCRTCGAERYPVEQYRGAAT